MLNKIVQIWLHVSLRPCPLMTNVLISTGSLKRTIYCYIWGIIFICSTYYRVMLLFFVCLRISHYHDRFIAQCLQVVNKRSIHPLICRVLSLLYILVSHGADEIHTHTIPYHLFISYTKSLTWIGVLFLSH